MSGRAIAAHLDRANEIRIEIEAAHRHLANEIVAARNAGATLAQCAEGAGVTVSEVWEPRRKRARLFDLRLGRRS